MKNIYKVSLFLIISVLAVYIISCSSSGITEITGSWIKPGYTPPVYKNILIIGITNDPNNRIILENAFAKEFKKMNVNATAGWIIIPPDSIDINKDSTLDEQEQSFFKDRIIKKGFDGALVLSLKDIKSKDYYVPGTVNFSPPPYYGYFYGYYFGTYSTIVYPGYYVKEYNVFMESNFYDVKKEELIWVAQSKTVSPNSIEEFSRTYSRTIIEQLYKDKVLK